MGTPEVVLGSAAAEFLWGTDDLDDAREAPPLDLLAAGADQVDEPSFSDVELMLTMLGESGKCLDRLVGLLAGPMSATADDSGEEDGSRHEAIAEFSRQTHTLKGIFRTVGMMQSGAILHAMEDQLGRLDAGKPDIERYITAYAGVIFEIGCAYKKVKAHFSSYLSSASVAVADPGSAGSASRYVDRGSPPADFPAPLHAPAADLGAGAEPVQASSVRTVLPQAISPAADAPADPHLGAIPAAAGSIRVSSAGASRLGEASGQVARANRRGVSLLEQATAKMADLETALGRLGNPLRELEACCAAGPGAENGLPPDPLETDRLTQVLEIARALSETYRDVQEAACAINDGVGDMHDCEVEREALTEDLQRECGKLSRVPLSIQRSRLERVVKKACEDSGKVASLRIDRDVTIPAAAMERVVPAIEHLVRNAIAHGIEAPPARRRAGKPESGSLSIVGFEEVKGGAIRVEISDDGAGIDCRAVLEAARARGIAGAGEEYSAAQVLALLFLPGFSTAPQITALSGRGTGLDVVKTSLGAVGGTVDIRSTLAEGTTFVLRIPFESSTMAVLPVTAAGYRCLVPLSRVQKAIPVFARDIAIDRQRSLVTIAGETLELVSLASRVVASEAAMTHAGRGHLLLMVEEDSGITKAVLVDAVGAIAKVTPKPLGPFVSEIPGLLAAALDTDGKTIIIVDPLRLWERPATEPRPRAAKRKPTVMVVDDSGTVRLATTRFLAGEGYDAIGARDGLEALRLLRQGLVPDTFLLDIEMPGMDGFQLITELRRIAALRARPIVMVSSRTSKKHRERAEQLGVDHYLVKPFEESQLLAILNDLIRRASSWRS
jgi:chemosensory pili system protein ChpA (sensor histidine kinase/response regulator)